MKVFITGGSGYLGRSTIPALVRAGHEVSALARSDASAAAVSELGAKPVHGSMSSLDVLRDAAAAADGVIHLGFDGTSDAAQADLAAATAMQEGTRGVYVHTGGVWVYGNTDGVATEESPQNPPQITAWRAANEAQVLSRGHAVLVMPGVVFGRDGGLLPHFFRGSIIGDGSNHWALVHVDDIADLYVRALTAPAGSTYIGVSFNMHVADFFTGKPSMSYAEALDQMGPIAEAFALDQQLSGDKARRELGWAPRHLADNLGEVVDQR
ncbi:NAD-dependent epimerase/dehydratase family protein [Kibdelosporangium philippinense]|uniref:NAD-dependent epimerase/dehydratase family protein n=1 Tax=Kibdelosporangium philippinense TaxID=211113 RepID=A0ABS8Z5L9_9PSEU|nr:NAD-dependent epimerase/dehydratase family protein [Kibdelosporangium philippinense]MCE7001931.1 NAD-dependent epimerase/dehydratase family protein [Kibdelosporangium philippinense]